MKRTHLPLNGLRVLDAAARHLSFTRAADELAVTPAAVGQQIRALEDLLGVVLFRRTPKGLELTDEAKAGLDSLRSGFLHFEVAVDAMQARQSSQVITIAAPAAFAGLWLAPRLVAYRSQNPDVQYHLLACEDEPDFAEANLDLGVRFGADGGADPAVSLGAPGLVRVAAANAPDQRIAWPGDGFGDDRHQPPAMSVGDAGMALQAAEAGLGWAYVPQLLAGPALAAGRLIASQTGKTALSMTYWLTAPAPQWRQKKVQALVAALTAA